MSAELIKRKAEEICSLGPEEVERRVMATDCDEFSKKALLYLLLLTDQDTADDLVRHATGEGCIVAHTMFDGGCIESIVRHRDAGVLHATMSAYSGGVDQNGLADEWNLLFYTREDRLSRKAHIYGPDKREHRMSLLEEGVRRSQRRRLKDAFSWFCWVKYCKFIHDARFLLYITLGNALRMWKKECAFQKRSKTRLVHTAALAGAGGRGIVYVNNVDQMSTPRLILVMGGMCAFLRLRQNAAKRKRLVLTANYAKQLNGFKRFVRGALAPFFSQLLWSLVFHPACEAPRTMREQSRRENLQRLVDSSYKMFAFEPKHFFLALRINYLAFRWREFRERVYADKLACLWKKTEAGGDVEKRSGKKKKKKKSKTSDASSSSSSGGGGAPPADALPSVPEESEVETPEPTPRPVELASLRDVVADLGLRDQESTVGGETTCIVCFEGEKTHAAAPCGHQSVCESCSAALQQCPYCRARAVCWMRVRVV